MSEKQTVHRYTVAADDKDHQISLPRYAKVLHVATRFGDSSQVHFWTEVVTENGEVHSKSPRAFRVFGTGHEVPLNYTYRGTALAAGDRLVWHLYERNTA